MRIFLAGGTGVIGTRLIPRLAAAGHEITATTRRAERAERLSLLGARPAVIDVYDAEGLVSAVQQARPDVILHELTDLSDYDTDANARLRREGTANLIAAAEQAAVPRILVQSIAWIFPEGATPATEPAPPGFPSSRKSSELRPRRSSRSRKAGPSDAPSPTPTPDPADGSPNSRAGGTDSRRRPGRATGAERRGSPGPGRPVVGRAREGSPVPAECGRRPRAIGNL
jgi:NAD(P)H-binding